MKIYYFVQKPFKGVRNGPYIIFPLSYKGHKNCQRNSILTNSERIRTYELQSTRDKYLSRTGSTYRTKAQTNKI